MYKPKLFLNIDLLPFAKLLELLAIDHSSCERMIISVLFLVVEVLPCSGYFITCTGAHFPAVELDNAIRFSILSKMSGFLWQCSKWVCRFSRFLHYTSGFEVLARSLDTDINYVTIMFQLRLSLNH